MQKAEVITSIVLSSHVLVRIAARDAGNEAPSTQWRALSILERRPGLRLGALAWAARTTQPGMTRLVGDLEIAGLVRRSPDPADSRATLVSATDAGLEALRAWRTELGDTLAPRFTDLDESAWQVLEAAAGILAAHSRENDMTGETE